jgi:anaerobic magnesium-protoporphyrin IX monomethyl ester cyclase
MGKVILFNPKATSHNPRLPNSILSIAASIEGKYEYVIVDGNLDPDPWSTISRYLSEPSTADRLSRTFACSVMPGPQLKQAIPFSKRIKKEFPEVKIIWGGYFPSNQPEPVLNSGYVDVIVNGQGDKSFPLLVKALEENSSLESISHLAYLDASSSVKKTKTEDLYDLDELPSLPYDKLNSFYPIRKYLPRTFMGEQTIAYHSSAGCPFTCSFCGIVPIFKARWKGRSAKRIADDIYDFIGKYGGDSVEFHDNNFFVSEKRTLEFSELIKPAGIKWWGEGRIDTIDKYKDSTLKAMSDSGCRMIFLGAETGNDALLKKMDKGGTQSGKQMLAFAKRLRDFNIIPEYSFVLGFPGDSPGDVREQVERDIDFILEVKHINPDAEIIVYVYSPVPTEGSEMFNKVKASGFRFPEKLEDWILPAWENFDLRKNPLTPWLTPAVINRIKNFETVLNGYYPTVSDLKLSNSRRRLLRAISGLRMKSGVYAFPYEIKALQKLWKYRQPEKEGF